LVILFINATSPVLVTHSRTNGQVKCFSVIKTSTFTITFAVILP